jgi:hypothetical protein
MGENDAENASTGYAQLTIDEELRDDLRGDKRDGETWTAFLRRLREDTSANSLDANIEIGDEVVDEVREHIDARLDDVMSDIGDEVTKAVEDALAEIEIDADVDEVNLATTLADEVEERLRG